MIRTQPRSFRDFRADEYGEVVEMIESVMSRQEAEWLFDVDTADLDRMEADANQLWPELVYDRIYGRNRDNSIMSMRIRGKIEEEYENRIANGRYI